MGFRGRVAFGLGLIIGLFKLPMFVAQFYNLALFVPSIAVSVRRMHDCNYSGWFLLVPVLNLMLLFREGDGIPNRFGEPTKPPEGNPYVTPAEPQKESA